MFAPPRNASAASLTSARKNIPPSSVSLRGCTMVMILNTNCHDRPRASQLRINRMKIHHIDLQVRDVRADSAFFQQHFGLTLHSQASSPAMAILSDSHGFILVLQRRSDDRAYPEGFHVGFYLEDEQAVRDLHARARALGAEVSDVIVNHRGTSIYFRAPDGYKVEATWQRPAMAQRFSS
jgi:catechol 2,3-dioxygenase-like lactoylglutathione lyase family enzyme